MKIIDRLKGWAARMKHDFNALRIAVADNLVPWYIKLLILFTVAYALSPVDLIPDFIPVIGLLDDIILVPLLMYLAIRIIPPDVMEKCRTLARTRKLSGGRNWRAGAIIILLWLGVIVWLILKFV